MSESKLAHQLLDGLHGIEIGGSAHNPFGLNTKNVDFTDDMNTVFKLEEERICGKKMPVDVVASGDELPFEDSSLDFVVNSHALEHFPDPIKALLEWYRVIRDGGFIFMVIPHKERTFDKTRERTTLKELVDRHIGAIPLPDPNQGHCSVWITEDVIQLCDYLGMQIIESRDRDDKVGNGFIIVVKKPTK